MPELKLTQMTKFGGFIKRKYLPLVKGTSKFNEKSLLQFRSGNSQGPLDFVGDLEG